MPLPYPGPPQTVASCSAHPGPRGTCSGPQPCLTAADSPEWAQAGARSSLRPQPHSREPWVPAAPFCRGQHAGRGRARRAGAGPRKEAVVSSGTSSLLARRASLELGGVQLRTQGPQRAEWGWGGETPGLRWAPSPAPGTPGPEVSAGNCHGTLTWGTSSRLWPTSPHTPTENPACKLEGGLSTRRRRRPREASPRSPASVLGSPASSEGHRPEG